MPCIPPPRQFWSEFYLHPAAVASEEPRASYQEQTQLLEAVCGALLAQMSNTDLSNVDSVVAATADFAFESPLTPPAGVSSATLLGDIYDPLRVAVCRCRNCKPPSHTSTDWLEGKCGSLVV